MMKRQPEGQKQAKEKNSSRIRRRSQRDTAAAAAAADSASGSGVDKDDEAGNDHPVDNTKGTSTSLANLSLVGVDPPPLPPLPTSSSSNTTPSNPEPTNYFHHHRNNDDDNGNNNNMPSSPAGDFIAKLLVGRYAATRSSSSSSPSSAIPTTHRISIISDNAKGKAMPPIIDINNNNKNNTTATGGSVSSTNKALSRWDTGSTLRSTSTTSRGSGSGSSGAYDNTFMDGLDIKKGRHWETERTNTPPKTHGDDGAGTGGGIIDEDMAAVSIAKLSSSYHHPFDLKDVASTRTSMLSAKFKDINDPSQQPLKMPVRRSAGTPPPPPLPEHRGIDVPLMLPPIRKSSFDEMDK